ncbi:MAG: DUF3343 domain-containing protein [Syntrophomonadaceae bacterium]|nr:DUF3343 domain-containing protein [Syntrophomonadaceae bacterium]
MNNQADGDIGSLIKLREYGVVTFMSTSSALKAERVMKAAERTFLVIPTPREISTSCGLSLKVVPEDINEFCQILREGGVDIDGVYHLSKDGRKTEVNRLNV